jgi:hypothetical protein
MAEALICRNLYKEVCILDEGGIQEFLDNAFPRASRQGDAIRDRSAFSAEQWLELTTFVGKGVRDFLGGKDITVVMIGESEAELPEVLVDVAIPKTMRSQKELVIVNERLGPEVSWRRIVELGTPSKKGCLLGQEVEPSPIFRIYGGRGGGEFLVRPTVRLFARGDLVDALRTHLEPTKVAGWLNAFRPSQGKAADDERGASVKGSAKQRSKKKKGR